MRRDMGLFPSHSVYSRVRLHYLIQHHVKSRVCTYLIHYRVGIFKKDPSCIRFNNHTNLNVTIRLVGGYMAFILCRFVIRHFKIVPTYIYLNTNTIYLKKYLHSNTKTHIQDTFVYVFF